MLNPSSAVTMPEKLPSPTTSSFDVGFVVPMPTFPTLKLIS